MPHICSRPNSLKDVRFLTLVAHLITILIPYSLLRLFYEIQYTMAISNSSKTKSAVPYPFKFEQKLAVKDGQIGQTEDVNLSLPNVRGRIPSLQTSRLRTMMLEASKDPTKILAHACTYDGLSSRLVEEAGFPMIFLAGYAVASAYGLPDTGYIAMQEVCDKIQETTRMVNVPVMADGDTGYGSPMNVKRTVQSFAQAGAAGIMIEDQTWPKRMYTTKYDQVTQPSAD